MKISGNASFSLYLFVLVRVPPIFSVLSTYSLKISSLLSSTHPVYHVIAVVCRCSAVVSSVHLHYNRSSSPLVVIRNKLTKILLCTSLPLRSLRLPTSPLLPILPSRLFFPTVSSLVLLFPHLSLTSFFPSPPHNASFFCSLFSSIIPNFCRSPFLPVPSPTLPSSSALSLYTSPIFHFHRAQPPLLHPFCLLPSSSLPWSFSRYRGVCVYSMLPVFTAARHCSRFLYFGSKKTRPLRNFQITSTNMANINNFLFRKSTKSLQRSHL